MAKLRVFAEHKFTTQGVAIQKGSKKTTLVGKKADDYLKSVDKNKINLYTFTSKTGDNSISSDWIFEKNSGNPESIFNIEWISDKSVFNVEIKGTFEKVLDETDIAMLFDGGQKIEEIKLSIRGLMFGEIWSGGFISRIDRFDAREDDDFFPEISFEFIP